MKECLEINNDIYPGAITYKDYLDPKRGTLSSETVIFSSPLYEAVYEPNMQQVISSRVFQKRALANAQL